MKLPIGHGIESVGVEKQTRRGQWPAALILMCGAVLITVPLLAFAIPATLRIPPLAPRQTPAAALFSHRNHDGQRCYACHPTIFPQSLQGFTHADMNQGRYCGACHDGTRATAITSHACDTCHVPGDRR